MPKFHNLEAHSKDEKSENYDFFILLYICLCSYIKNHQYKFGDFKIFILLNKIGYICINLSRINKNIAKNNVRMLKSII